MFGQSTLLSLLATCTVLLSYGVRAAPLSIKNGGVNQCKNTRVAVLGAGCAGIFAAQALQIASIDDFLIVEYNDEIGGRTRHTTFGQKADGLGAYTVELGANWVQGLVSKGGPENPIWRLAKKWSLKNKYSNYSSIRTFDESGATDYTDLFNVFQNRYTKFENDAGYIPMQNLQDRSARTGFSLADWTPRKDPKKQAVEWFEMDFEYGATPEQTSQEFSVVNYNSTFYQYSDANNYVFDQRGYNTFIKGEASTFLEENDPRLLLNTIVTDITYSEHGVTVYTRDGMCIDADYAIITFSIGVLQSDAVKFHPELPEWKRTGIESMTMATYTKIFLQFPPAQVFWERSIQYFLYADPVGRGYYPLFQSLDCPGFLEGSGILFVTVVQDQAYQVESQFDEVTKMQVMDVLRKMFGADKVPEPIAFTYPRWSLEPWAYGSYSNWPPSFTLEMHENLRASVGRLWFAGEATSAEYFGFLQAAYFEGQQAGMRIAECIHGNKTACKNDKFYEELRGTTPLKDYSTGNDWTVSSFLTYGYD